MCVFEVETRRFRTDSFRVREPVFVGSFHPEFISPSSKDRTDCTRVRDEEVFRQRKERQVGGGGCERKQSVLSVFFFLLISVLNNFKV